jgi:hypothetical protein
MLIERKMRLITASGDDLTEATDPSRIITNVGADKDSEKRA